MQTFQHSSRKQYYLCSEIRWNNGQWEIFTQTFVFFYNYSCLPILDNLYSFFKTWALFYLNKALMKETSMFYGSNFYEWYYSTKFKLISKFGLQIWIML